MPDLSNRVAIEYFNEEEDDAVDDDKAHGCETQVAKAPVNAEQL